MRGRVRRVHSNPPGTRMVRRLAADAVGMAVLALPLWTGPHPAWLPGALSGSAGLRARGERPRSRAAKQRDELAPLQVIELHSVPASQAGLQDIELARISQQASCQTSQPERQLRSSDELASERPLDDGQRQFP